MADNKDPSVYHDRSFIGSKDDLDEYGVWVKSEPQTVDNNVAVEAEAEGDIQDSLSDLSFPDIEDLPALDFDPLSLDDAPSMDGDVLDLSETDEDFPTLPEMDDMPDLSLEIEDAPEEIMAAPEEIMAAPEEILAAPEEILAAPEEILAAPEEILAAPEANELPDIEGFDLEDNIEFDASSFGVDFDSGAEAAQLHEAPETDGSDFGEISMDDFIDPSEFGLDMEEKEEDTEEEPAMSIDLDFSDEEKNSKEFDSDSIFEDIIDETPTESQPTTQSLTGMDDLDLEEVADFDSFLGASPESSAIDNIFEETPTLTENNVAEEEEYQDIELSIEGDQTMATNFIPNLDETGSDEEFIDVSIDEDMEQLAETTESPINFINDNTEAEEQEDFDTSSFGDIEVSTDEAYIEIQERSCDEDEEEKIKKNDLSTDLLMRIADELSTIKDELSSLKTELASLKLTSGQIDAVQETNSQSGFFEEEDDEKIALTGDELDNILNTADFTEEEGGDVETPAMDDLTGLGFESDIEAEASIEMPQAENAEMEEIPEVNLEDEVFISDLPDVLDSEEEKIRDLDSESDSSVVSDEDEFFIDLMEDNDEQTLEDADTAILDDSLLDDGLLEDSDELNNFDIGVNDVDGELDSLSNAGVQHLSSPPDSDYLDDDIDLSSAIIDDSELIDISLEDDSEIVEPALDEIVLDDNFDFEDLDTQEPEEDQKIEENLDELEIEIDEVENFPEPAMAEETFPMPTDDILDPDLLEETDIEEPSVKESLPNDLKGEVKAVLAYMDQLLESLPDDKIEEFARSEYFETYKKLFEEFGLA